MREDLEITDIENVASKLELNHLKWVYGVYKWIDSILLCTSAKFENIFSVTIIFGDQTG